MVHGEIGSLRSRRDKDTREKEGRLDGNDDEDKRRGQHSTRGGRSPYSEKDP